MAASVQGFKSGSQRRLSVEIPLRDESAKSVCLHPSNVQLKTRQHHHRLLLSHFMLNPHASHRCMVMRRMYNWRTDY